MQKLFWISMRRSIATQISSKIINRCNSIRSVSSQISSKKSWPWVQQQQTQSIARPLSLYLHHGRYCSTDSSDDKQQIPNEDRKIPRMSDVPPEFGSRPFSFFTLLFRNWKLRQFDSEFAIDEFIEGSKEAIEVVSNKLANSDFDGLRGLVTDDVIDDLREKLSTWTNEQRSHLRSQAEDICRYILRDIEIVEEDDQVLVKITMVYHVVEGFKNITDGKFDNYFQSKPSAEEFLRKSSEFLDENLQLLNYTFIKDFSKGANADWIISSINHTNIKDEMDEQRKIVTERIRKMRETFEKQQKK